MRGHVVVVVVRRSLKIVSGGLLGSVVVCPIGIRGRAARLRWLGGGFVPDGLPSLDPATPDSEGLEGRPARINLASTEVLFPVSPRGGVMRT